MTPNQSHIAGLELALQQWSNGGPSAHFAAQLRGLIEQAKSSPEPVQSEAGKLREAIADVIALFPFNITRQSFVVDGGAPLRADDDDEFLSVAKVEAALGSIRSLLESALNAKPDHIPDSAKMVTAYISGHLDENDAPAWPFISAEAVKVGAEKGHIDSYRYDLANGGVVVLWDSHRLHALAVTVRDDMNRTRCIRVLAAPAPSSAGGAE